MEPNTQKRPHPPRIFVQSVLDARDDPFELRHDKCYSMVANLLADKGDKEANVALAAAVTKHHEEICIGLIVFILSDSQNATRYFRDLTLVARDGLQAACNHMTALVLEKYPKMVHEAKEQLLWLTREMIKSSVNSMENICWNLMRQIAGGDVSNSNLWLAENLLHIFIDHQKWLEKFPFLLASVVYTYLRIIEDHNQPRLETLRNKEVNFVVGLMRERFSDVIVIGRDLLRVLQYVAKIPEFEKLWMDIINNPKDLAPNFTGVTLLMHTRTSRRFLQSRITPEMEKKLVFLTSQVRFGTHKRYQDWFQKQYLSTQESQSLRCDLIRFIVGVIHPTNELLGSDIIPRWAVIGWLLTTCTTQVASCHAKLALFYDWLFFIPEKDNIMNIEPAILVMHHSMRPHPAITATLLDFLCRISVNFYPKEREKVHTGISNSLKTILDKRVLPSLLPLFDNPKLDEELRLMLRERFPQFVAMAKEVADEASNPPPIIDQAEQNEVEEITAKFSDDEEEDVEEEKEPAQSKGGNKKSNKKGKKKSSPTKKEGANQEIPQSIKDIIKELQQEAKNTEKRCEVMDNLVKAIIDSELDFDHGKQLAVQIFEVLQEEFETKIFPKNTSPESLQDSIGLSIFVVFRTLCEMQDSDGNRGMILPLLAELYALTPRIGYYLLYFLVVDQNTNRNAREKASIYNELCEAVDENYSLELCLVNDMRQCQEDDVYLFVHLIPEIFNIFPKQSVGNTDLLYLVVSCVDGTQVVALVCRILAKDLVMFKKDSFPNILTSSLGWETFEQYVLWQLAGVHDLPIDCIISMLPKLSYHKHSEALTFIAVLLKKEKPTAELLRSILTREIEGGDKFTSSVLSFWMQEYDEKLGDLISNQLYKQASLTAGKRKRAQTMKNGNLSPSAETCLMHLDVLRQNCKELSDFFGQRSMQSALQHVRNLCTETQKKKFMDLFALAGSDSEPEDSSGKGNRKSSKASNSGSSSKSPGKSRVSSKSSSNLSSNKRALNETSDESSDDSEAEVEKNNSRSRPLKSGAGRGKNNPRKRGNKVSYKIYSDESTEDDEALKRPPKKKKVTHSESD